MVTGMGMWFQNGSEMGMKFEVIGSWKGKNVLAIGPTVALIPGGGAGAIAPAPNKNIPGREYLFAP